MNAMLRHLPGLAITFCFAAGARTQEQASTLLALTTRADVVTVATVVAATDPSPEWHRLVFRTTAVLAGAPGDEFTLLEPAGRCCGRALFQLVPGGSYLMFLERRGPLLHPIAADRGVIADEAVVVQHVRNLLAAGTDPAARARLLALGLDSVAVRVRDDAALALATLPGLATDAFVHARVMAALQQNLPLATTRLPALAEAAVRTGPVDTATILLPLYLAAAHDDAARALGAALLRLPARVLGDAIAVAAPTTDAAQVRALDLLATVPDATNLALIDRMLDQAGSPRVALAATEALLAHGRPATALQSRVPRAVLDLARQRAAATPGFRVVRPRSTQ